MKNTNAITGEIVISQRPIDKLLRRQVSSDEACDALMRKEEAFLALQRELFQYCTGRDMGVLEDYDDAGGFHGVGALLTGKQDFEGLWVLENIIRKEAERYALKDDAKAREIVHKYLVKYHKDILFAHYSSIIRENDGTNFYFVRKSNCTRREKAGIIARADEAISILSYGNEQYLRKFKSNPWEEITKMLQGVIARTEPMINKPFIKTGIVKEWVERDLEGYYPASIMVEPVPFTEQDEKIFLDNWEKEQGERRIGQQVRYLDRGSYLGGGCTVGKLVAPQLYIPIPVQEQLSIK